MSRRGLWTDARLRAAWARADFAGVFRQYRRLSGLSQTRLGELVGLSQAYVSIVERGRRHITQEAVIARIAGGLGVPEELGGIRQQGDLGRWHPPPELRERVAHAHATGRADLRAADAIGDVLAHYRRTEDEVGGRDLWPVVSAQLTTVTALLPATSGRAADRLLILAAEHAHWLSWVASREGQPGAARAWLDLAAGWAAEAGAADMAAWVGRVRARYLNQHGDPLRALRVAEAAYAAGPLSPAAEAVARTEAALAAAACGDRALAGHLADRAVDLAAEVPAEEDRPPWLYWLSPARVAAQRGEVAYASRDWQGAVDHWRDALADLAAFPRDHAYYASRLEDAQARV
ncbi:helix-turn-helix domain-containing protein [Streptomyces youssoufiensis]